MELESSYNLLSVVRDDGIRTYRALEIASGQELQVHLFAKLDSVADRALFKALRALPVSKRRELLEIGMEGETPYVVTDRLADGATAREWLTKLSGIAAKPSGPVFLAGSWKTGTPIPEELLKASHASAPPAPAALIKQEALSADYTRVMRVPQNLSAPPPPLPSNPSPEVKLEAVRALPEPARAESVLSEPPARTPEAQVSQKPQTPAPLPAIEEDDEFARMFGDVAASPVAPSPPPNEPGEFTRKFLAGHPPEAPPGVVAPPPQGPTVNEPGEFTRQFLAVHPAEPAETASPHQPQSDESTSRFLLARPPQPVQASRSEPVALQNEPPVDEATHLFQSVQSPPPPPVLQTDPLPAVQPPPVQPSSDEPTRLFQAVTPLTPPPDLKPQTGPVKEPGEFTRMFPSAGKAGSPAGPGPVPDWGPDPQGKEGPSEFTRFFQSPMHPSAAGNQSPLASTPSPQQVSRSPAQPSEFTQMFGNPNKPPSTPSTAEPSFGSRQPVSGAPGSATGLFSAKAGPPRAATKTSNSPASGPGEFTRMMSASAPATLGQPLGQSNTPDPKAKSNILLYIAAGAVLLAILLIVVFFALRH